MSKFSFEAFENVKLKKKVLKIKGIWIREKKILKKFLKSSKLNSQKRSGSGFTIRLDPDPH